MTATTIVQNGVEYELTETETQHILKSLTKVDGFYIIKKYTKDKTLHEKTVNFIHEFIARII